MKTSKALIRGRGAALIAGLNLCLFAGCAFEVENPENPAPISPKRGGAGDARNSPDNSVSTRTESRPAANIPLPNSNCTVSLSRGAANSSGQDGASVELAESSASDGSTLLMRTLSTPSFIEVKDIVFASSGVFSASAYTFEFYKSNGQSCYVRLSVESTDIEQKLKISVSASLPQ